MYSLDHLTMFVTVVETGSFSACGRKLNKAQSAISQGIANLELDLAMQLFDRSTRKPTLTDKGQHLLSYARAVLKQAQEMQSVALALDKNEEAGLVIALEDALLVPKLQQLLTDFSAQFPATALTIKSVPSNGVAQLVNLQQADLGLMFCDISFPHEVDLCYLGCVDFVAVVAANHDLAESGAVSAADLIAHRQLLMVNTEQEELIQLPPLSANIWYCDSFHTLHALVEQGLGWSYLPIHMIEQEISAQKLKILAVTFDHKPWNVAVDRVMQKNQASGPALSWLSEQMKNIFD